MQVYTICCKTCLLSRPEVLLLPGLWQLQVNGLTVGSAAADSSSTSGSSGVRAAGSLSDRPGVFASKAMKAGQILAVVPLELALPVNTDNLLVSWV
jgi:hypothetical protein